MGIGAEDVREIPSQEWDSEETSIIGFQLDHRVSQPDGGTP